MRGSGDDHGVGCSMAAAMTRPAREGVVQQGSRRPGVCASSSATTTMTACMHRTSLYPDLGLLSALAAAASSALGEMWQRRWGCPHSVGSPPSPAASSSPRSTSSPYSGNKDNLDEAACLR